jgi:hypothetical protein
MLLEGSCHCGAVRFKVDSQTPYPYLRCYCSICRKTQGGGGYAINIMGDTDTLKVTGARHLSVYRARWREGRKLIRSPGKRHFCAKCGSALWVWDPRWPKWVYPFASAIDTPLPRPPETQHCLVESKPSWVALARAAGDRVFRRFPNEAIIDWHRKRGLLVDGTRRAEPRKKRR